jgi:hypothetical protein
MEAKTQSDEATAGMQGARSGWGDIATRINNAFLAPFIMSTFLTTLCYSGLETVIGAHDLSRNSRHFLHANEQEEEKCVYSIHGPFSLAPTWVSASNEERKIK